MQLFNYCSLIFITFLIISECRKNSHPVSNADAAKYLSTYGYIAPSSLLNASPGERFRIENTLSSLKAAIRKFQAFAGLRQTGELDEQTKMKMAEPRCGVTDVLAISREGAAFKWNKNDLTYSIESYSEDLPHDDIRRAVAQAFQMWSDVTPLNFREVRSGGNIKIKFASRYHGDPWPFDGEGGVLAHATMPPNGMLHFDEDENWVYMDPRKIAQYDYVDLLAVAIHEIGHTLGLDHSRVESAIMTPFYQNTVDRNGNYIMPKLDRDDIRKIQDIYGPRRTSPSRTSFEEDTTTRRPNDHPRKGKSFWDRLTGFFGFGESNDDTDSRPSGSQGRVTSTDRSVVTPDNDWSGAGECPNDVDAVTQTEGITYLFSSTKVYEIMGRRVRKVHSLKQLFPSSPAFVQAALTNPNRGLTLLFQDRKVYAYSFDQLRGTFKLNREFPKRLPSELRFNPMGAFIWIDGHQVLTNAGDFAIYDENWNKVQLQNKISSYFPNFPPEPIRGIVGDDTTVALYANDKVYKYDTRRKDVIGVPVPLRTYLNC